MDTRRDAVGEWATLPVRARDHDSAVSRARAAARRDGFRVEDVAQATRQGADSRVWHVELRLGGSEE